MEKVSIIPCEDYKVDDIYLAIKKGIKDIGFKIKKGSKVLIKPNVLAGNPPEKATVTHPKVIEALCKLLKERDCDITIGDSSAYYVKGFTMTNFKEVGIEEIAKVYKVKLMAFEREKITVANKHKSRFFENIFIPVPYKDFDLIINVPKLKVHSLTKISGAIKNMYGVIPGGIKQYYHDQLKVLFNYERLWGEFLNDVYLNLTPDLCILDGIIGLERDGPAATGDPKRVGVIMVSKNGWAMDYVISKLIEENVEEIPVLADAQKRNLINFKKIKIIGKIPSIDFVKVSKKSKKPKLINWMISKLWNQLYVQPKINLSKCNLCMECLKECPVNAITLYDNKVVIDQKSCIHCYGCENYCPQKAIYFKGSLINRIINTFRKIIKI